MTSFGSDSRIGFVGAGKVGSALAIALHQQGYRVVAAASRNLASAEALCSRVPGCATYRTAQEVADTSDIVFITTTDDTIEPVTSAISWRAGQGVVHCSGAESLKVLDSAVQQGAQVGAAHPLQAFSTVDSALEALPGTTFGIEAEGGMREFLEELAIAVGGRPIFLKAEDKPLYHATVVLMGGILLGYAGAVADLLARNIGIERSEAMKSLLPIMQGCVSAIRSEGMPGAIIGPYLRGDVGTVSKHLEALNTRAPDFVQMYCHMALAGIPLAVEKGLDPEKAAEIRGLLESYRG